MSKFSKAAFYKMSCIFFKYSIHEQQTSGINIKNNSINSIIQLKYLRIFFKDKDLYIKISKS